MNLTFRRWLSTQEQRPDPIGGLARAMAELDYDKLPLKRKPDEHKRWADIVTRHGEPKHILAFNQAWREYQSLNDDGT